MLEAFTLPRAERATGVPRLAAAIGVRDLVYLATCNRVEVAFARDGAVPIEVYRRRLFTALAGRDPRPREAENALRVWQDEGAAEHIFLVTAGLDSARVGEHEIASQVREAVDESRAFDLLGSRLECVFTAAMKLAKRVRPINDRRIGCVSLADIALRHVLERMERTPGRVALVGVSPMTERCARTLAARGIRVLVVNRTLARAQALAVEVGGEGRGLQAFRDAPDAVEALIIATGAQEPIFDRAVLERLAARTPSGESPLVVDMGVPANVAPEDAAAADVPRIGMDDISDAAAADRSRVLMELADARALVDLALADLRRQAAERLVGPMIARLRLRYRHTALEGIQRLFERDLAGLGEKERDAIQRWTETLARRFAHLPSVGLRDLVFAAGPSAAEAFCAHSEPELLRELHDAMARAGSEMAEQSGEES